MQFISYAELEEATENSNVDQKFKEAASFLFSALTDWPKFNLKEPSELILEIKKEIGPELRFTNLEDYSKKLSLLKNENDSWKIESLAALLELFDFERNRQYNCKIELEEIILNLTNYFRTIKA